MMRYLAWTAMLALLSSAAQASQCVPVKAEKAFALASLVAEARVEKVEYVGKRPEVATGDNSLCGDKWVTFRLLHTYKGGYEAYDTQRVFSQDGCYGLGGYFKPGSEIYALYVNLGVDGIADTHVCNGTKALSGSGLEAWRNAMRARAKAQAP